MKYLIVAIKDQAIDAFQPIFNVRAPGEGIRAFQDAINKPDNPMNSHADDYDLYSLGTFDDTTGQLEPTPPNRIAVGKQLKITRE